MDHPLPRIKRIKLYARAPYDHECERDLDWCISLSVMQWVRDMARAYALVRHIPAECVFFDQYHLIWICKTHRDVFCPIALKNISALADVQEQDKFFAQANKDIASLCEKKITEAIDNIIRKGVVYPALDAGDPDWYRDLPNMEVSDGGDQE
ncbi:MAG: hypothetical protein ABFD96_21285 [Armatimonadia bacterium]